MYVLGIVGGVASGKSAVADAFSRRGAVVLDADRVGHEVLQEPAVITAFRKRWGDSVVDADGQIIRREVARRVFGEDANAVQERAFLNNVTHPRIRSHLQGELKAAQSRGVRLAVIDAALLFETGWNQLCDGVLFVDTPRDIRRDRAMSRGWSAEQFAVREASQWPVEEKKSRATWVIANNGALAELEPQVERILGELSRGPHQAAGDF